ncbi:MAG: stage V sporulation protein AD, partial [Acutalibacteraceae bacterium]
MAKRLGKNTIELESKPRIISNAAVVGKKEGEGPLGKEFDLVYEDTTLGEETWEKAESSILEKAVTLAIDKANLKNEDINVVFAGDLLNQCMSSCFGVRDMQIPFAGVYGACSTMALSLIMASLAVETNAFEY